MFRVLSKVLFLILSGCNKIARIIYENYYRYYILSKATKCSKDIIINGRPYFYFGNKSRVYVGSHFICRSGSGNSIDNTCCSKIKVLDGATLKIGDFTGISNTTLECHSEIIIGNSVNIGAGTMIFDTDFHSTDWRDRENRSNDISNRKILPVHIGDCVFIGARCIICKGVNIGEHSMISAGSVVIKDIPANELWGGNPAKFIKKILCIL